MFLNWIPRFLCRHSCFSPVIPRIFFCHSPHFLLSFPAFSSVIPAKAGIQFLRDAGFPLKAEMTGLRSPFHERGDAERFGFCSALRPLDADSRFGNLVRFRSPQIGLLKPVGFCGAFCRPKKRPPKRRVLWAKGGRKVPEAISRFDRRAGAVICF